MNPFAKFWQLLDGKKWYIGVVAESIAVLAYHWGYIDEDTLKTASVICGTWLGFAWRSTAAKQQIPGTPGQAKSLESIAPSAAGVTAVRAAQERDPLGHTK